MTGMSSQLEAELREQEFVLGKFAIHGQWTTIFGAPGTGKTLVVMHELLDAVSSGLVDPANVFYINADDSQHGLTEKLKLVEPDGLHMVAPGYRDFRVQRFLSDLHSVCEKGQASSTVIVLDTLKKFTDLMDKRTAAAFGIAVREFISRGGTLIALAHVNKHRGADGKPIYAGTSDIVDDADCAFVLDVIHEDQGVRTVGFECKKSRGKVIREAAYQYSIAEDVSYAELVKSVKPVAADDARDLRSATAAANCPDQALIQALTEYIARGYTGKTKLAELAARKTGVSRRQAMRVLDMYTGIDPDLHHWHVKHGERGVKLYALSTPPGTETDTDDLEI